jgi:V/A-type H+-transporting ATPase subunit C
VQGLITALANTAYRQAVGAALARYFAEQVGLACLAEALRNDLIAGLGKVLQFFPERGTAGELAALVLRSYDLHNVKTVLRGLARYVPADEILAGLLPVGELRAADLAELARAANLRAAIDLLATWRVPLARPLLELPGGGRASETAAMELALDRWHLSSAMRAARETDGQGGPLLEALRLEADRINILTALRLVGVPDVAALLREHFSAEAVEALFVGPGQVPFAVVAQAARRASVTDAARAFTETPYGALLASAIEAYTAAGHLSVFERALDRQQLWHAASLLARDPLGVGVLVGYAALKTNEIRNLRAIGQGLALGEKPDRIRAELMFVD